MRDSSDARWPTAPVPLVPVLALLVSVGAVLVATLAPGNSIVPVRIPPRWCLVCGGGWLMDAVSNMVLFLPFGLSMGALSRARGWSWFTGALGAALLSFAVESLQSAGIPSLRSPSLLDVVTNTTGGTMGVLLWHHGRSLWWPRVTVARRLAIGWTFGVLLLLGGTAAALMPRAVTSSAAMPAILDSPFDYTPGFGWFGGRLSATRVNGTAFADRGIGPVVLETHGCLPSLRFETALRGRDTLAYTRVMLFLHPVGDTLPTAFLSQRGSDLELHIQRRGTDMGLYMPSARISGLLAGRSPTDTVPLHITGQVTRGGLSLAVADPDGATGYRQAVTVPLTPFIGWAMLQSVIPPTHPIAPFVELVFLLVLFTPLAHWSRLAGPRWPLVVAGLMFGAIVAAAQIGELSLPAPRQLLTALVAFGVGLMASRTAARGGRAA